MKIRSLSSLALIALAAFAGAQSKSFKVGGNDARQLATVESDTTFETFTGRTHKVVGQISFDPAKKSGSARLEVDLNTVDTGIALRDDHMRSEGWLDTAKYPKAIFETTSVKFLKGDEYEVKGKFTMKGVTKDVTTRVKVRYLPESAETRSKRFEGDILHIAGKIPVKLADYGVIIPAPGKGKVAETVTISISAFGTTK
jgi:polyisoprenoid-binding protein YceI